MQVKRRFQQHWDEKATFVAHPLEMVFGTICVVFCTFFVVFSTMHPERHFIDICAISNIFPQTFGEVFGDAENNDFYNLSNEKTLFLRVQGLQFSIICVIVFGPPPGPHFQCFFVDLWNARHFLTPKKRSGQKLCECMLNGGEGCPTKIKDMPIRNGFLHQFTPAVPKGTGGG